MKQQDVAPRFGPPRRLAALAVTAAVTALALAGCTKETDEVPPIEVKPVEVSGMTIDHDSTPSQVAYALLRAMVEDQQAAQSDDHDKQEAALVTVFRLAAYPAIEKAVLGRLNSSRKAGSPKITSLGDDRDQRLYDYVKLWTPIAGHYLSSVAEDFDSMVDRLHEEVINENEARVYCLLAHDVTATAPAERQEMVLEVRLVKVKAGAQTYWRVARLDYPGNKARKFFDPSGATSHAPTN